MVFEQRVDGLIDFNIMRFSEKTIWQAIENAGIIYEDWIAYKDPGEQVLNLMFELKDGYREKREGYSRKNISAVD